jgi:hypothetical protein
MGLVESESIGQRKSITYSKMKESEVFRELNVEEFI